MLKNDIPLSCKEPSCSRADFFAHPLHWSTPPESVDKKLHSLCGCGVGRRHGDNYARSLRLSDSTNFLFRGVASDAPTDRDNSHLSEAHYRADYSPRRRFIRPAAAEHRAAVMSASIVAEKV